MHLKVHLGTYEYYMDYLSQILVSPFTYFFVLSIYIVYNAITRFYVIGLYSALHKYIFVKGLDDRHMTVGYLQVK